MAGWNSTTTMQQFDCFVEENMQYAHCFKTPYENPNYKHFTDSLEKLKSD